MISKKISAIGDISRLKQVFMKLKLYVRILWNNSKKKKKKKKNSEVCKCK